MQWRRMPMESESPEEYGYDRIRSNLAESSCTDLRLADLDVSLDDLVLLYGDHRGHEGARALIAADGATLRSDDVLLCAGAAMALFVVHATLLGPDTHLVVAHPNYATNLETPRALGGRITEVPLRFEDGWRVDLDRLDAAITEATALVSLTTPHNPTGVELSEAELRAIVALCEARGCRLLLDQTYRDLTEGAPLSLAAALSPACITVSSVSKTYGVPGLRCGWIVCADRDLMTRFLAAKEQIVLTGSVIDEALGYEVLRQRPRRLPVIRARLAARRALVGAWMDASRWLQWVAPTGGVTGFPRIRADAGIDPDLFHRLLRDEHAVFVGPGRWFGLPERYFRIGWGWPDDDALRYGLAAIDAALDAARVA